jgi:CheY-like chemotaxis protein
MEKTVLLVDDVRLFLEIQKEYLQNSSVKIMTANNGIEALHAICSKRPDLIFMDLEMPEMNGDVCCRAIKSRPETASIPVVMITSKGDETSRINCRSAGCDDFLTKPFDRVLFLETARRYLADADRREMRKTINISGVFSSRGATFPCALSNLSVGGAFVTTDFNGDLGRVVQITFALPDGLVVECQARICWLKRSDAGSPLGFGVNFVLLPSKTKDAMMNFFKL